MDSLEPATLRFGIARVCWFFLFRTSAFNWKQLGRFKKLKGRFLPVPPVSHGFFARVKGVGKIRGLIYISLPSAKKPVGPE